MKKLYKFSMDVLFVVETEENHSADLNAAAVQYAMMELQSNGSCNNPHDPTITEIVTPQQIPENWKSACVWGTEEETSPEDILLENKNNL